jgi:hypothetical protein
MLMSQRAGQPVDEGRFRQEFIAMTGRTDRSFDLRMENINHVLLEAGRETLRGFGSKAHVGAGVQPRIEAVLRELGELP